MFVAGRAAFSEQRDRTLHGVNMAGNLSHWQSFFVHIRATCDFQAEKKNSESTMYSAKN